MLTLAATIQLLVITAGEPAGPVTDYVPGPNNLGMRFSALAGRFDENTRQRFASPSEIGVEGAIYYVHRGLLLGVIGWIAPQARIERRLMPGALAWPEGETVDLRQASLMAGYRLDRGRHAFGPTLGFGGAWLQYVGDAKAGEVDELSACTRTRANDSPSEPAAVSKGLQRSACRASRRSAATC